LTEKGGNKVIDDILEEVKAELFDATLNNEPFHSAHEGYAVILEEVEELQAEVFKKRAIRNHQIMREEAIQVAAMAIRFIYDICDTEVLSQ
jgi:hypothetical protein